MHYSSNFSDIGEAAASGQKDALSVVGLLLDIDSSNGQDNVPWLEDWSKAAEETCEPNTDSPGFFDVYGFMKNVANEQQCFSYYNYFGGLTTPGCNQLVNWIVIDTPLRINLKQVIWILPRKCRYFSVFHF